MEGGYFFWCLVDKKTDSPDPTVAQFLTHSAAPF